MALPAHRRRVNPSDPAEIQWDPDTGLLKRDVPAQRAEDTERAPWNREAGELIRATLPDLPSLAPALGKGGVLENRSGVWAGDRILLFEPDDELQRLVAKLLIRDGFDVSRAYSWDEVCDLLARRTFDVLLTRHTCLGEQQHGETIDRLRQRMSVHILDEYGGLIAGERIRYERMARGLLGTLDVLVASLERGAGDFSLHAGSVARYARLVGRRLGIGQRDLDALSVAAYLHGLAGLEEGDTAAEDEGIRLERLLAGMELPYDLGPILGRQPASSSGADPPATARILEVVDAYAHECQGAQTNPTPGEAFAMLRERAGTRFDPQVVEVFANILRSDLMLRRLDRESQQILVVTPDPAEANLCVLRLKNEGYGVIVAASLETAMDGAGRGPVAAVVARYDMPDGDGLDLLRRCREEGALARAPVFLVTTGLDNEAARKALHHGAEDVMPSPVNVEILAVKLNRALERLGRVAAAEGETEGVRGKIEDLGIIEAVQILGASRRSATISLQNRKVSGAIFLREGRVIHAECGDREPVDAFVEMAAWTEGRFRIKRTVDVAEVTIQLPTDGLLLESCRRIDEADAFKRAIR